MQHKILALLIATAATTCGVRAQDATTGSGSTVIAQPTPMAQTAPASAPVATVASAPTPNQIIYSPRLPSAAELTNTAAAGWSVEQIIQSSNQVTVVYRAADGQTNAVAYQLLPTSGSATATTVVTPTPAPTVVYQTAPSVVYYESYRPYPYYYPRYYSPPVSLHLGFGYSNYHGGRGGHGRHW